MTEFERYLFDLQGFLVIDNVLNRDEIAALQSLLDRQIALQRQILSPPGVYP